MSRCVVVDVSGSGQHEMQNKAELESSYVEGKVIVCRERNRRPLCLRIRLALACYQTSGPPTSTLLPRKASLQHDGREQGGSAALHFQLLNRYESKVPIEALFLGLCRVVGAFRKKTFTIYYIY